MGLDTTYNCWHGGYMSFHKWRMKIAEVGGYNIVTERGIYGYDTKHVDIDWELITEDNLMGIWEEVPSDPLLILIAHSDCEGKIDRAHTKILADRLAKLVPLLPNPFDFDYIKLTKRFISGLRTAHRNNADVKFQ